MMSDPVLTEEASPARRLLLRLVSLVCRFPRLVLAVSFVLAGLSLYVAATRLQYQTQRNDLMSARKEHQQRWREYLAEFGDDDDAVVVIKGLDRPSMERAVEAIAAQVRARPELFDRLFYKVDLRPLRNRALLFLSTEEIEAIQNNLRGMGLLLQFGPISWRGLTLTSLLQEAQQRAGRLANRPGSRSAEGLSAGDEQFFTQLLAITRSARDVLADPASYRTPWSSLMVRPKGAEQGQENMLAEPQYFLGGQKPGEPMLAFLLVRPVKDAGSFTAALKSVTALREVLDRTRPAFPGLEIGLTGLPVLETDEMAAADHDTRLASWLAIVGVSLLFLVVYRGLYYPLLTVVTLLTGTAWAMGWLTVTVGHLNILSATFAVMLIGMGDYGVLWVMRYEQARSHGAGVREALLHTTTHVAVGNLTAAATLALAFFAAMLADFQAVAELGWIAGCGVLLCAFACFTVLPALLMICDRRSVGRMNQDRRVLAFSSFILPPSSFGRREAWLPGLARRARGVVVGGLTLTLVLGGCAIWGVTYDHNLLHLQARDLDAVKWELTLIEHTCGTSWHALSYTDSPEEALALKARYEKLEGVSRVVEVASLVPTEQERKLPLLRNIRERLHSLPERGAVIPHARPDRDRLQADVAALVARLAPRSEQAGGEGALLADLRSSLTALHAALAATPVGTAGERLQDFEQRLAGDLAEDLHRLREVATPKPITLDDLPAELRVRYVGRTGKWLLRVFARDSLWDFPLLERFTEEVRTVDPHATGKPFSTVEGLKAMKGGLQRAGLYAFAVIALVLLLDFRSWRHALLALAPLVMSVVLTLGVLGLFRVPLNPANMIAFPLILGVGVDNGVHVLHDYLLRRREPDGQATISYAIGRGVLVKALTTMIGFGTLMISTERGLSGLGLILTLGVGCSMLTALIFLPALLHLRKRPPAPPVPVPEPEAPAYRLSA
jgi:hopanoid biosynthesis associated RND transporter like protein HpnN